MREQTGNQLSSTAKESVPLHIPKDIWQPLVEIRAQLDASCPGAPTPIEEALREIVNHYRHCTISEEELRRLFAKGRSRGRERQFSKYC